MRISPTLTLVALAVALAAALGTPPTPARAATCEARSGARPPLVVELYTSEGCSSCPPADRWLSSLRGRDDLLPLAFHVNYWDRLGWPDRFASAEATRRQRDWARAMGAPNVYTPQVIAGGADWRRWPALPAAPAGAPMALRLSRDGGVVRAEVGAAPPPRDAAAGRVGWVGWVGWVGYWAVVEHGHASRVTAGENRGETLRHDHIVRQLVPVPPWIAGAQRFELAPRPPERGHPQRIAFVVAEADTLRPVQALALDC